MDDSQKRNICAYRRAMEIKHKRNLLRIISYSGYSRISDMLTGIARIIFGRKRYTSSIPQTPMRSGIGNATPTKLSVEETKPTRETSIESALIIGGHCIE